MRSLLCLVFLFPPAAWAQEYLFEPGAFYTATLPGDQYTVHQISIYPQSEEPYQMNWRLVDFTCPQEWDFQLCDWATCYDGFPNTGEMDPIEPGGHGLLKLTVNPFQTAGSGVAEFWVFPAGQMELHQSVFFSFSTLTADIRQSGRAEEPRIYPQPASQQLWVEGIAGEQWKLFSSEGMEVAGGVARGPVEQLDASGMRPGLYIMVGDGWRLKVWIE